MELNTIFDNDSRSELTCNGHCKTLLEYSSTHNEILRVNTTSMIIIFPSWSRANTPFINNTIQVIGIDSNRH